MWAREFCNFIHGLSEKSGGKWDPESKKRRTSVPKWTPPPPPCTCGGANTATPPHWIYTPLTGPVGELTPLHPLTASVGELTPSHPPAYWICGGANTAASAHCTCWGAFSAMTWLLKADHIVQMLRVVFVDWYPQMWRQHGAGVVEVGVEMGGA